MKTWGRVNTWGDLWKELRFAFAEWLMWTAAEILPTIETKLELGVFLLDYAKRRAAEIQTEKFRQALERTRFPS